VDDNPDVADTLAMVIGLWGYDVQVGRDGPEGVKLAQEFLPHVVLLDIGLPGMDGYETAREVRRQGGRSVVLIALTGQDQQGARSQEAGFDHHLTKPVDAGKLQQLLASL
jgi:two-component system CheB/CheR fusion protein